MTHHILVPHDGSEQSDRALAAALNTFPDAELTVFRAVEPFADHTGAGGYAAGYSEEMIESVRIGLLEAVESVLETESCDRDLDTITIEVSYGRPIHQILRYIEQHDIDQIVMGSHGRDGATRILLGSVAETVVRRSPVPVTVVREGGLGIDSILVPYDGSSQSRRALEYALEQHPAADITALYVVYPGVEKLEVTAERVEDPVWGEEFEQHIERTLNSAQAVAADVDRTVRTEQSRGKPQDAIVEYVEDHDIDQVVMGSSGRDGLARLLLGSVAETVVRRSPVSVTVTR